MAKFRISRTKTNDIESPVLMFLDLKKDHTIKYLWGHQEKLLDQYHEKHFKKKDIAIELPTGSGKTLIGLLIADFRRRALHQRAVYLCPTRQLCHQVALQSEKYGIPNSLLIGKQRDYNRVDFLNYQKAEAVAITTYSGIFNINPKINDPEVMVFDDAHAAEDYISSLWTVSVTRYQHEDIFESLVRGLNKIIPEGVLNSMNMYGKEDYRRASIDLISPISAYDHFKTITEILNEYLEDTDLIYAWRLISDHLDACLIYCSQDTIEIRPVIPPTLTHPPFADAIQRIYMSATLGENGDIERVFGVRKIERLPIPEGWDKRGTGRRLILFPGLSGEEDADQEVTFKVIGDTNRCLMIVPDNRTRNIIADALEDRCVILGSDHIEQDVSAFVSHPGPAILLLANRYDGLDLPGDDCRVIILFGLFSGTGLQDKYFLTRLGAVAQLRDRIRTRITQAMGRCTRDESDYSLILVLNDDLLKWFCTKVNTRGMHPEIQAEIAFGVQNSEDRIIEDLIELVNTFFSQNAEWDEAENYILEMRDDYSRKRDPNSDLLKNAAKSEVKYIYDAWNSNHENALKSCKDIVDLLEGGNDLKPYRSFWHHQASVSGFFAWRDSENELFKDTAIDHLQRAIATSFGLKWLVKLQSNLTGSKPDKISDVLPIQDWYNELNSLLEKWGIQGGRFARELDEIKKKINSTEAKSFENGLAWLGRMLGARTHEWKDEGAPDGLWVFGDWHSFVFEAKTNKDSKKPISLNIVRQASTHEERVRADGLIPPFVPCSTIIISSKESVHKKAIIHSKNISHISHEDIIKLFADCSKLLEDIRSVANSKTDESFMSYALRKYKKSKLDMKNIKSKLLRKQLGDMPLSN